MPLERAAPSPLPVSPARSTTTARTTPPSGRPASAGARFAEQWTRARLPHHGHASGVCARDTPGAATSPAPRSPAAIRASQHDALSRDSPTVRAPTERDGSRSDPTLLLPFLPPPVVLAAPPGAVHAVVSGRPAAPHEVAALAERVLRSVRIGSSARHGHEVRLELDLGTHSHVEVRLRDRGGEVEATLVADPSEAADVDRLEHALRAELEARGITFSLLTVEAR